VKGWLLDTNVIASLIAANGAPSVKQWARAVNERDLFISILTLGEYDKGIANLPADHGDAARYSAARDALEARFAGRILSLEDPIVRRWGAISGRVKRGTGHPPPVIDTLLAATAIEAQQQGPFEQRRRRFRSLARRPRPIPPEGPAARIARQSSTGISKDTGASSLRPLLVAFSRRNQRHQHRPDAEFALLRLAGELTQITAGARDRRPLLQNARDDDRSGDLSHPPDGRGPRSKANLR